MSEHLGGDEGQSPVDQGPRDEPSETQSPGNKSRAGGGDTPTESPFHSVLTTGLLHLFGEGEDDALGHFLAVEGSRLLRYIDRRLPAHVRGPIGIEDILQEVVISLAKMRDRGELEVINTPAFRGLVRKITQGVVSRAVEAAHAKKRDIGRKASPGPKPGHSSSLADPINRVPADIDSPSMEFQKGEQLVALERCLVEMTVEEVEIIDLKHRAGLDHAEIADSLGISVDAARQRFHRAIEHLRQLLHREYPDSI